MISTLQAAGHFFPDSTGGTEVYVEGLARALDEMGCTATIVAPSPDQFPDQYAWRGVRVERYPWDHADARSGVGLDGFLRLLDRAEVSIYHQHSWTSGCGADHLRAAKERGFRTVTTVHVPGNVCLTGTMMRMGEQPCDGRIDEHVCSKCWAVSGKGIPAVIAGPMTRLSRSAARLGFPLAGGLARLTQAFDGQRGRFELMDRYSDRIVAVCQWLYDALLLNGISRDKLVLCRQGTNHGGGVARVKPPRGKGSPLRVGFLGRYDKTKGLHVLVQAFRSLAPALPVELRIHGITNSAEESVYAGQIRHAASGDRRIAILPPVSADEAWDALAAIDVLAVPSQWMETGPLVVLEALAAGTPVLGSRLGGIAELVNPGVNGWLVSDASAVGWALELERLCVARDEGALALAAAPVRTMRDVAREMRALYEAVLRREP